MPSFDISSEIDMQELDNAINQVTKEISTRYDFRGSKTSIELDKTKKIIKLLADDDYKMNALIDILQSKAVKRGIALNAFKKGKIETGAGSNLKCEMTLVVGIEQDVAKDIIRHIKDSKMKVQGQINEDKVRVNGKKRDDLQEAIGLLKGKDFGIPLQFGNFRD